MCLSAVHLNNLALMDYMLLQLYLLSSFPMSFYTQFVLSMSKVYLQFYSIFTEWTLLPQLLGRVHYQ